MICGQYVVLKKRVGIGIDDCGGNSTMAAAANIGALTRGGEAVARLRRAVACACSRHTRARSEITWEDEDASPRDVERTETGGDAPLPSPFFVTVLGSIPLSDNINKHSTFAISTVIHFF